MQKEAVVIVCDGCGRDLLISDPLDVEQDWDDLATRENYTGSDNKHFCDLCSVDQIELTPDQNVIRVNASEEQLNELSYCRCRYLILIGLVVPEDEADQSELKQDSADYPQFANSKRFVSSDCINFIAEQSNLPYQIIGEFVMKVGDKTQATRVVGRSDDPD